MRVLAKPFGESRYFGSLGRPSLLVQSGPGGSLDPQSRVPRKPGDAAQTSRYSALAVAWHSRPNV